MADTNPLPTTHFVCVPCRIYQRHENICRECDQLMEHGTLCRCGERKAARGADECIECIGNEARLDPSVIEGLRGTLRDEVLAHLRRPAVPTYQEGAMFQRQVGER